MLPALQRAAERLIQPSRCCSVKTALAGLWDHTALFTAFLWQPGRLWLTPVASESQVQAWSHPLKPPTNYHQQPSALTKTASEGGKLIWQLTIQPFGLKLPFPSILLFPPFYFAPLHSSLIISSLISSPSFLSSPHLSSPLLSFVLSSAPDLFPPHSYFPPLYFFAFHPPPLTGRSGAVPPFLEDVPVIIIIHDQKCIKNASKTNAHVTRSSW